LGKEKIKTPLTTCFLPIVYANHGPSAIRACDFHGAMESDHVPLLSGDKGLRPAGTAYCIAVMRAWLRRANEEVG
jgi:hypothetical protein